MRLHVEFMQSGRSSSPARATTDRQGDKSLFWWIIIITLLLGAAIASWFMSIFIFSYPERPWNYNFLRQVNKVEKLKHWKVLAGSEDSVPSGKFLGPREVFQEFDRLSDEKLQAKSALLKRSYITNYSSQDERPTYVKGKFRIYHVRPLTTADIFTQGLVVRAQALDIVESREEEFPNTIIEFVFPTDGPAQAAFSVNDVLAIDTTSKDRRSYASIINIERVAEQKLLFTVVPLVYGTYNVNKDENLQLALSPPAILNMNGKWPITEETVGFVAPPAAKVVVDGVPEAAKSVGSL
jgi:hypothetical protein